MIKKINLTGTILPIVALTSCKKDYICKCISASAPDHSFTIHNTKEKAKKQCSETIYFTGTSSCELQ